jgi:flagella basal body P-ring formation protein FlgA
MRIDWPKAGMACPRKRASGSSVDWIPVSYIIAALISHIAVVKAAVDAPASALESHQRIVRTARDFIAARLAAEHPGKAVIDMGSIDDRLRLPRCGVTPQGFLPAGGRLLGNVSIGVRCGEAWKLYVPARVKLNEDVLVAATYLPRGVQLRPEDFTVVTRELADAPQGYFTSIDQAVGMIVKQPILAGTMISPSMLKKPTLIRRGDEVDIVSRSGTIEVRMKGSALGDGCEGDRVKVRNKNSKRIIEGLIDEDGSVVVQM